MAAVTYDFAGTSVLVTGAARGIGRDIALGFARAGAAVALADVGGQVAGLGYATATNEDFDRTLADARATGADAERFTVDVRSETAVEHLIGDVVARFGRLDVLVNNAGVYVRSPSVELTEEQWDVAVDVNLKGPFLCSKHAARHMVARGGGGRIVTISSTSALVGIPNQVSYQSSKHGLVGQVRTLAVELAPHGVTVNTICPTVVETPMLDYIIELRSAYFQDDVARLSGASTVFPGVVALEPRDVTAAALWLSSDAARYVTGIALPIDGGFTCK
jgi:NAD(P)-dependent dehydrogenase (short-subunit alcohol dehydrogenase family)